MATILLRGNVTPGEVSIPSGPESPIPREPLFAFGGLADMNLAFGNSELAINISSGIGTIPLVSRRRQVELTGIQDVGGRKTFGLANISITGGLAGQVLTTVSPGNLGWANPSAPGANYTFERGLTEDPPGTVSLNIANEAAVSAAGLGGVWVPANVGLDVAPNGALSLRVAGDENASQRGGVWVPGPGIDVSANGALSLRAAGSLNLSQLGGVWVPGPGLDVSGNGALTLGVAGDAPSELGGVWASTGLRVSGTGGLSLVPAGVSAAELGGVYVPIGNDGLIVAGDGLLQLQPATDSVGGRGGVYVPQGTAPDGGLNVNPANGALTLQPATDAVRGGVHVPEAFAVPARASAPGLRLGPTPGALSLLVATPAALGGVYVPGNVAAEPAGGLAVAADGAVTLLPATSTRRGGAYVPVPTAPATSGLTLSAQGALGVDPVPANVAYSASPSAADFRPVTAAVLRYGDDPANLPTTADTIVPAIRELFQMIQALTGQLTIVGSFNASASMPGNDINDEVTPIAGSPHPAGPLIAAAQRTIGWFLLVDTDGTPAAPSNAPRVPMTQGDMLIGVPDADDPNSFHWGHVSIARADIFASNVIVTTIPEMPSSVTDVQTALEFLAARGVEVDGFSIKGDGLTEPLEVDVIDGGIF